MDMERELKDLIFEKVEVCSDHVKNILGELYGKMCKSGYKSLTSEEIRYIECSYIYLLTDWQRMFFTRVRDEDDFKKINDYYNIAVGADDRFEKEYVWNENVHADAAKVLVKEVINSYNEIKKILLTVCEQGQL